MNHKIFLPVLLSLFVSVSGYSQTNNFDGRNTVIKPDIRIPQRIEASFVADTGFTSDRDNSLLLKTAIVSEDQVIKGNLAVGTDSPDSPGFGINTILLTENNLRIHFDDNSATSNFPNNDWTLVANDAHDGGENYFAIQDATSSFIPFKVMAGAPADALYVSGNGDIGLNTGTPRKELHIKDNDTPAIRLEQDNTAGWAPQTWDVAGNEVNFFIRDVTNTDNLPFKIRSGAPTNSLYIAENGYIGLNTNNPNQQLHVDGSVKIDSLLKLTPVNNTPVGPEKGDIWMDGTENMLKYYDGTAWKSMDGGALESKLSAAETRISDLESQLTTALSRLVDAEARITALEATTSSPVGYTMESELYQNVPNPAGGVTTIPYFIPSTVSSAKIVIYDSKGGLIKEYIPKERAVKSFLTIEDSELSAGIYYYSLIVDGKQSSTKSMVVQ